jgi:hypothetical protein
LAESFGNSAFYSFSPKQAMRCDGDDQIGRKNSEELHQQIDRISWHALVKIRKTKLGLPRDKNLSRWTTLLANTNTHMHQHTSSLSQRGKFSSKFSAIAKSRSSLYVQIYKISTCFACVHTKLSSIHLFANKLFHIMFAYVCVCVCCCVYFVFIPSPINYSSIHSFPHTKKARHGSKPTVSSPIISL